jgi:hypothetical protein
VHSLKVGVCVRFLVMPKAKSAAAKKHACAQKTAVAIASASSSATLDSQTTAPKRRQLSRRDTEGAVERALTGSHFRHISSSTLANKTVDGKTIRQCLTELLHDLEKGQRLGSTTYATLARQFSEGGSCVEALRPSVADLPIDDTLISALALLEAEGGWSKSLKAMQIFLEGTSELNERNLIGLVRSTMSCKMLAKQNIEHLILVVMKYFVRHVLPNPTDPRYANILVLL